MKKRRSILETLSNIGTVIGLLFRGAIFLFFLMFFLSFVLLFFNDGVTIKDGNIALIPINGLISTTGTSLTEKGTPSQDIVEWIEDASRDDNFKAILLEINSPGGTPVATQEIADAIKEVDKPVYAYIRESGASGAYWIASTADRVYSNPLAVTGSIGVTASHLEFGGLLADYNVTYRRLVAGKYKDLGSVFRDMTEEEQLLYQKKLDLLHEIFIKEVSVNRKMPEEKVRELANGFVYFGTEAKELGLVDEIGGKKDALRGLERKLNITAKVYEYKQKPSIFNTFGVAVEKLGFSVGTGIGSQLNPQERISLS